MTCPKCDGQIDAFKATGDGAQKQWLAPYICGWCGSLFIIDLRQKGIYDPKIISEDLGIDVLTLLQKNTTLWDQVLEWRARILALPGRRPVLR